MNAEPQAPLAWMRDVRDNLRPTPAIGYVLVALALRMRADGSGFASIRTLADDSGTTERTVKRALDMARREGRLDRTKRGNRHLLPNGKPQASRWQLTKAQSVTAVTFMDSPSDTGVTFNDSESDIGGSEGDIAGSEGDTRATQEVYVQEVQVQEFHSSSAKSDGCGSCDHGMIEIGDDKWTHCPSCRPAAQAASW